MTAPIENASTAGLHAVLSDRILTTARFPGKHHRHRGNRASRSQSGPSDTTGNNLPGSASERQRPALFEL